LTGGLGLGNAASGAARTGLSAASKMQRVLSAAKIMSKGSAAMKHAARGYITALNMAKGLVFSTAYEGIVETQGFIQEAKNDFTERYFEANGVLPSAADTAMFEKNIQSPAAAVFGANVALVGFSHFKQGIGAFGKGVKSGVKKSLFSRVNGK
jgi:hypothetical protein